MMLQDEMRSLECSVSTESSAALKYRPSSIFTAGGTKVKVEKVNEEPQPPKRRKIETRATSTVTSTVTSSVEIVPTTSSRRSERTKSIAKEKERTSSRAKRESSERKRYYESDSDEDVVLSQYRESREKNNEASRKSRMNKKAKESEMAMRAIQLEKDNKVLKMKVEELEKLVTSMRNALLQSALKREI